MYHHTETIEQGRIHFRALSDSVYYQSWKASRITLRLLSLHIDSISLLKVNHCRCKRTIYVCIPQRILSLYIWVSWQRTKIWIVTMTIKIFILMKSLRKLFNNLMIIENCFMLKYYYFMIWNKYTGTSFV